MTRAAAPDPEAIVLSLRLPEWLRRLIEAWLHPVPPRPPETPATRIVATRVHPEEDDVP